MVPTAHVSFEVEPWSAGPAGGGGQPRQQPEPLRGASGRGPCPHPRPPRGNECVLFVVIH